MANNIFFNISKINILNQSSNTLKIKDNLLINLNKLYDGNYLLDSYNNKNYYTELIPTKEKFNLNIFDGNLKNHNDFKYLLALNDKRLFNIIDIFKKNDKRSGKDIYINKKNDLYLIKESNDKANIKIVFNNNEFIKLYESQSSGYYKIVNSNTYRKEKYNKKNLSFYYKEIFGINTTPSLIGNLPDNQKIIKSYEDAFNPLFSNDNNEEKIKLINYIFNNNYIINNKDIPEQVFNDGDETKDSKAKIAQVTMENRIIGTLNCIISNTNHSKIYKFQEILENSNFRKFIEIFKTEYDKTKQQNQNTTTNALPPPETGTGFYAGIAPPNNTFIHSTITRIGNKLERNASNTSKIIEIPSLFFMQDPMIPNANKFIPNIPNKPLI